MLLCLSCFSAPPFGRWLMCRSEMPFARRTALCKRCISLSNAEGLLPTEKEVLYSDKHSSLVSARKGKNKGKYIRLETKQAKYFENTTFSEDFMDKSGFFNKMQEYHSDMIIC